MPSLNGHKSKYPSVRIPSDDCAVVLDGETYHPHAGEWVELTPLASVGRFLRLAAIGKQLTEDLEAAYGPLCEELAKMVVAWSWTDQFGDPLPPPHGRPDVIADLAYAELLWLLTAATDAAVGRSKNA